MEKSRESSYTTSLTDNLRQPYTREKILSAPYIDYEYNPKLIIELLDCLRIENCIINVASKLLNGFDRKDRWYNTEYRYEPINENLIKVSNFYRVISVNGLF